MISLINLYKKLKNDKRGSLLVFVMIFGTIAFTIIISGIAGYAIMENRASNYKYDRDLAFHIAEAGANYYRWHLAHDLDDYTDGTGLAGPYEHEYRDKDGELIGYFSLEIDEPLPGSHLVTVRSTGRTIWSPENIRTVQIKLGFPSLTDYAFVENANMNFSPTTIVHGKVHSNGFIQFDAVTDSWVDSSKPNGVSGAGGPVEFWRYPVPEKDFYGVSADLGAIRDMADDGGIHLNSSGKEGYHIVFKPAGTFSLYKVTSRDCYYGQGYFWWWWWIGETHCYDIGNQQFVDVYNIPDNGAIFVEDNVWVEGTVNGRVTVGAGRFPVLEETYQEIYITGNLIYNEKASDDVIGLIAQGDVIVPYEVPNDMEIDAAALSQFKKIYRPYYKDNTKNSLTFFGSQISFAGGGWKWGTPVVSGFVNTNHIYDGNLKYYSPPGFPVGNSYDLISWEELE